jgi:hypothetical protein
MKNWLTMTAMLLLAMNSQAQWSLDMRYQYFWNQPTRNATEVFNLTAQTYPKGLRYQQHGYGTAFRKYTKISATRGLYLQWELSYHRMDQRWSNIDVVRWTKMENGMGMVDLMFNPKAIKGKMTTGPLGPRYYFTIGAGYSVWRATSSINDNIAFQSKLLFNPVFSVGVGHRLLLLGPRLVFSPFVKVYASPFWNSTVNEKIILGTSMPRLETNSLSLQAIAGVEFSVLKKEKKRRGLFRSIFKKKLKSATDI